jgi:nucleoside-diphosphate-sugar epimerase
MAKKVLLTGCSGYLGRLLALRLLEHPLVARVTGVDRSAPDIASSKFRFVRADIRDEYLLRSVLEEENVDTVFHLAFLNADDLRDVRARETNVHGSIVVLEAANKCPQVQKFVISGSTAAYGAKRRNPKALSESHPLKATGLAYAVHKRFLEEELAKAMPQMRKSLQVSVLRLCLVVGPGERPGGPIARLRRLPLVFSVLGRAGGLQFLSESDALEAFCRALEAPHLRGAFNVAPDDSVTVAEVCRGLGKLRIPVPGPLLTLGLWLARRFFKSTLPPSLADYLAYPVAASNQKFKAATGFKPAHGSLEALLACARSLPAV